MYIELIMSIGFYENIICIVLHEMCIFINGISQRHMLGFYKGIWYKGKWFGFNENKINKDHMGFYKKKYICYTWKAYCIFWHGVYMKCKWISKHEFNMYQKGMENS